MKKLLNRFYEKLANDHKFNAIVYFGNAVMLCASFEVMLIAMYFKGMREGVDITDEHYSNV